MLMLNSNTLATWCKEPTHWKKPWCWERLKTKGEGGGRRRDVSITNSVDMNLSKLWETVEDRGNWYAAVHGVTKSWTVNWAQARSAHHMTGQWTWEIRCWGKENNFIQKARWLVHHLGSHRVILMWHSCNCFHNLPVNLLDSEALVITASQYKSIYKWQQT